MSIDTFQWVILRISKGEFGWRRARDAERCRNALLGLVRCVRVKGPLGFGSGGRLFDCGCASRSRSPTFAQHDRGWSD
jgi:hypothetical protein